MTSPARIGVLGLGRMGLPITRALVAGGYDVTVFDPAPDRVSEAVSAGAVAGSDERDVAAQSEVLVTVLPGSPELLSAMEGAGGAIDALPAGSCWIDLTSNDPEAAARLAAMASSRGVDVVGAPMMGGPDDAESQALRFYLGGADDAIERALPVLRLLGPADDGIRTGPTVASAHLTKLLANGLWFGQVVAVTEAMLLGKASGLDPAVLASALARGPGGRGSSTNWRSSRASRPRPASRTGSGTSCESCTRRPWSASAQSTANSWPRNSSKNARVRPSEPTSTAAFQAACKSLRTP